MIKCSEYRCCFKESEYLQPTFFKVIQPNKKVQYYCPYHLPLDTPSIEIREDGSQINRGDKASWTEEEASDEGHQDLLDQFESEFSWFIKDLAKKGAIHLSNIQWPSRLLFIGINAPDLNLAISNSSIEDELSIQHSVFNELSIRKVEINGTFHISNCSFASEIALKESKIDYIDITRLVTFSQRPQSHNIGYISLYKNTSLERIELSQLNGVSLYFRDLVTRWPLYIHNSTINKFNLSPNKEGLKLKNEDLKEIDSIYLEKVAVAGYFNCSSLKFLNPLDLSSTTFNRAPIFHDSKLHPDSIFPRMESFLDRSKKYAASRYRHLRLDMEEKRNRDAEGMFFALEQECIRNRELKKYSFQWLLSHAYHLFSDYGQSPQKAARWIGIVFLASTAIYLAIISDYCLIWEPKCEPNPQLISNSITYSIKQLFSPFSGWKNIDPMNGFDKTTLLQLVATIQSSVSLSLFGLFLLALRWKYKRG